MDLDLTEYDQFDEIKFLANSSSGRDQQQQQQQQYQHRPTTTHEGNSSFLVTLSSSSSEPTSSGSEDANCENDYVFLPSPPPTSTSNSNIAPKSPALVVHNNNNNNNNTSSQQSPPMKQQTSTIRSQTSQPRKLDLKLPLETGTDVATLYGAQQQQKQQQQQQQIRVAHHHPLMAINSNASGNPFYNLQQASPELSGQSPLASAVEHQPSWLKPVSDTLTSKPIGVLDITPNIPANQTEVSALMYQIVTRSDSIYIAIPCDYCLEHVACPPSDISAWLNHMSGQHNCKICPICNKLVGLGPRRDIEIMKKHVLGHFDDDWLERRAIKTNFTHGLQKYWFSGGRCTIKESRSLGSLYNRK